MNVLAPPSQNMPPAGAAISVGLHVIEGAVLDDIPKLCFVDRDVQERSDLAYRAGQIGLHPVEVNELDIRQIPDRPPGTDVFPERPERITPSPTIPGNTHESRPPAFRSGRQRG